MNSQKLPKSWKTAKSFYALSACFLILDSLYSLEKFLWKLSSLTRLVRSMSMITSLSLRNSLLCTSSASLEMTNSVRFFNYYYIWIFVDYFQCLPMARRRLETSRVFLRLNISDLEPYSLIPNVWHIIYNYFCINIFSRSNASTYWRLHLRCSLRGAAQVQPWSWSSGKYMLVHWCWAQHWAAKWNKLAGKSGEIF